MSLECDFCQQSFDKPIDATRHLTDNHKDMLKNLGRQGRNTIKCMAGGDLNLTKDLFLLKLAKSGVSDQRPD